MSETKPPNHEQRVAETEAAMKEAREWNENCLHWRGRLLIGKYAHWCHDWDGLPIDETCPEWPCACAAQLKRDRP